MDRRTDLEREAFIGISSGSCPHLVWIGSLVAVLYGGCDREMLLSFHSAYVCGYDERRFDGENRWSRPSWNNDSARSPPCGRRYCRRTAPGPTRWLLPATG